MADKIWVCTYKKGGKTYSVHITAKNRQKAQHALNFQYGSGTVEGELVQEGTTSVAPTTGDVGRA